MQYLAVLTSKTFHVSNTVASPDKIEFYTDSKILDLGFYLFKAHFNGVCKKSML